MKLTENFTLEELTKTTHAIIENKPNETQIEALKLLCEKILQPLRDKFGAINISSGYRCEKLNTHVKGSVTSQHLKGEACDFVCRDIKAAFIYIYNHLPFDQLIWEYGDDNKPSWIHVSYSNQNRRQCLRKSHGKKYEIFKPK